jgi:hypothetical protein
VNQLNEKENLGELSVIVQMNLGEFHLIHSAFVQFINMRCTFSPLSAISLT